MGRACLPTVTLTPALSSSTAVGRVTKPAPRRSTWWTMVAVNGSCLFGRRVSMNTGKLHVHFDCHASQEPSMAHKIEGTGKRPPPRKASSAAIGVRSTVLHMRAAAKRVRHAFTPQASISKVRQAPAGSSTSLYKLFTLALRNLSLPLLCGLQTIKSPANTHEGYLCPSRIANMSAMDMFWAAPPVARYATSFTPSHPRTPF
jgi:hypothetical protein